MGFLGKGKVRTGSQSCRASEFPSTAGTVASIASIVRTSAVSFCMATIMTPKPLLRAELRGRGFGYAREPYRLERMRRVAIPRLQRMRSAVYSFSESPSMELSPERRPNMDKDSLGNIKLYSERTFAERSLANRFFDCLKAIPLLRGISASRRACWFSRDRKPQDGTLEVAVAVEDKAQGDARRSVLRVKLWSTASFRPWRKT
jgi:hypothetical protein